MGTFDATSNHRARLEIKVRALSADFEALTVAWDAVEEVDTNLGVDVEDLGDRLLRLLDDLAAQLDVAPATAAELASHDRELANAVDYYAALDEHDTGASIDIFDRLAPGIGLAERVLAASAGAAAGSPWGS